MAAMRVQALCDLWNDDHSKLIVLAGTMGRIIGRCDTVLIVAFADGNSTYCMAHELLAVG
jgi:hypothetical protein